MTDLFLTNGERDSHRYAQQLLAQNMPDKCRQFYYDRDAGDFTSSLVFDPLLLPSILTQDFVSHLCKQPPDKAATRLAMLPSRSVALAAIATPRCKPPIVGEGMGSWESFLQLRRGKANTP